MKRRDYILSLISEGEHEHQDFKYQISDARKIARSISAFANHSGGHLLVGVKDNGRIVGVSSDEEIFMIEQAAQLYCRPEQEVHCELYKVEGKMVLKADIEPASVRPVLAPDDNGTWRAYYRVADENIVASDVHMKVLESRDSDDETADAGTAISYGEHERELLGYLRCHGGITVEGYMRLAHCSSETAQEIVVALCNMGVVELAYHDGQCLIVPGTT